MWAVLVFTNVLAACMWAVLVFTNVFTACMWAVHFCINVLAACMWAVLVFICFAERGSRSRNRFLRPYVCSSVRSSQYLLSVICNSNSFQSILFKLCTVFVYILQMCTSYYGLIWRFVSYIFCMLNLVMFYHYMSWTVPRWCNLKLQQCSINIIQTLHSVCIHIEDVHLLLWADLTNFSVHFPCVELSNLLSLYDIDGT